jgi:hypothetical protein
MTQFASRVTPSIPKRVPVPPLENGDQLTRDEFERRWDAMPQLKKVELIEGTVYIPAALSHDFHSAPHFDLIGMLSVYRMSTPGVVGGHGVKEYIVWRTMDAAIDWMILENGQYKTTAIPSDGIIRSTVLPGLWLNAAAILQGDWAAVLQQVQAGIASPAHNTFVSTIQRKALENPAV